MSLDATQDAACIILCIYHLLRCIGNALHTLKNQEFCRPSAEAAYPVHLQVQIIGTADYRHDRTDVKGPCQSRMRRECAQQPRSTQIRSQHFMHTVVSWHSAHTLFMCRLRTVKVQHSYPSNQIDFRPCDAQQIIEAIDLVSIISSGLIRSTAHTAASTDGCSTAASLCMNRC